MAILKILQYPDLRLRKKARDLTVDEIKTPIIQQMIDDMFETMGTGNIAAALTSTQLDLPEPTPSIVVIDSIEDVLPNPICLINLKILNKEGTTESAEACMSIYPHHVSANVKRAEKITIQALDRNGKEIHLEAEGFLSRCIQHEEDHLHGILYIDYLSKLKLNFIKRKISKIKSST